ncbi:hypothetical protein KKA15_04495 [Patescibacteria group bacterium]|nr:hypothetical protein [Patescibacteria group bacterium]
MEMYENMEWLGRHYLGAFMSRLVSQQDVRMRVEASEAHWNTISADSTIYDLGDIVDRFAQAAGMVALGLADADVFERAKFVFMQILKHEYDQLEDRARSYTKGTRERMENPNSYPHLLFYETPTYSEEEIVKNIMHRRQCIVNGQDAFLMNTMLDLLDPLEGGDE